MIQFWVGNKNNNFESLPSEILSIKKKKSGIVDDLVKNIKKRKKVLVRTALETCRERGVEGK